MASPNGQFIWYDLITTDPSAAQRFYGEVAGWGTADYDNVPGYTMFTNNGEPGGGYVKAGDGGMGDAPPHWLPYVGVPNVDQTAARAKELGGQVVSGPADIPNTGRYAIIADPYGAVIAIFTPSTPGEPKDLPPARGQFSWNELTSSDNTGAMDFYQKIFGWEKQDQMDMGAMGTYIMYGKNGKMYGGMMNAAPGMPIAWLPYVMVDSADKAAERSTAAGGSTILPPMEVPGGDRVAVLRDPQGAAVGVHSRKSD
ncbi:MAG TPA: VOC family protein [Nitrospiraceae bacterium]|nr:VOC family protein [Nitrospiraceae bacterium]